MTEWSLLIQDYAPTSSAEEAELERFYKDLQDLLELTPPKDVLFIIGDWTAKVGSQELPGVTGKFGLGKKKTGQRLIEFCQENALVIANTLFKQPNRRQTQHRNHRMVNTKSRLIMFFASSSLTLVEYEGYSISSKGFLPTVVDIMLTWIKFARSSPFYFLIPKMSMLTLAISFDHF